MSAMRGLELAPPVPEGRRWRVMLAILMGWIGLGLLEAGKSYLALNPAAAPRISWTMRLLTTMPWWLAWAGLTPLIVWFASRVRLDEERHRIRAALAHLLVALTLSVLHLVVTGSLFHWTTHGVTAPTLAVLLGRWIHGFLISNLLTYGMIAGMHYAITYARKYRTSELTAAQLSAQAARLRQGLVEAKLHALQRELNPHFLFNSLNAVSGLIRRREIDPAVTMLARVSDLLRATLERGDALITRLDGELSLLDLYLEVERARFGPRLEVDFDIAPGACEALLPTLMLQPLVENAVRHGVAQVPGPARIAVRAVVRDNRLSIEVRNTGSTERRPRGPHGDGIGLANTRARLAELYGQRAGLTLELLDDGALVRLWLPYHTEPAWDESRAKEPECETDARSDR